MRTAMGPSPALVRGKYRGKVPNGTFPLVSLGCAVLISLMLLTNVPLSEAEEAVVGGGYISPRLSSAHDSIWRAGSENDPDNTSVTLTLAGAGSKGITLAPQDVVFIMDHSGSLQTYDPQMLRVLAAHEYVNNMIAPFDRAALLKFDNGATLFHHLTASYPQVHADLESLERTQPQGQTNFQAAMDAAITEFEAFGNAENQRIGILFTDGVPDPPEANVTPVQMDRLVADEVKLYTIGLGPMVDTALLQWMAKYTGGSYYHASTAQELVDIYLTISNQFYNYTAGANIIVEGVLNDDFQYRPGSSNVTIGFEANSSGGVTRLIWRLDRIMLGGNASFSFRVESADGEGRTRLFQSDSTVRFVNWKGENITSELPAFYIEIVRALPPPLPPPPPPPPPLTPAPIPPPPSVPVIAPSVNVAPVITATPNITPVTIGQTATVPVEYMLAGLATLGIASRTALKKKIAEKQRIGVGA